MFRTVLYFRIPKPSIYSFPYPVSNNLVLDYRRKDSNFRHFIPSCFYHDFTVIDTRRVSSLSSSKLRGKYSQHSTIPNFHLRINIPSNHHYSVRTLRTKSNPINLKQSSSRTSFSSLNSSSIIIMEKSSASSSSSSSVSMSSVSSHHHHHHHRRPTDLAFPIDPSIPLPVNSTLNHPFDPFLIHETISIVILQVPAVSVSIANVQLKHLLMRNVGKLRSAIPPVHDPQNRTLRWLLLKPEYVPSPDIKKDVPNSDHQQKIEQFIQMIETTYKNENNNGTDTPFKVEIFTHNFTVPYEDMTTEAALTKLLPKEALQYNSGHIPCSFEIAGHLAHINLREELAPWRYIIGRVILDKNPVLRTVVNKLGNIENIFRTFPMEIIAGENNTLVDMRHCSAQFAFDFREVYWNSRLQTEHDTLVQNYIPPNSIVADMFCGVGPFTVPLGMDPHNCTVYGNDLNPSSIAALIVNMYRNRKAIGSKTFVSNQQQKDIDNLDFTNILKDTRIKPYNMDARDFVRYLVKKRIPFQHAVMNLPADGLEFCDVFVGYYRHGEEVITDTSTSTTLISTSSSTSSSSSSILPLPLPRIHVYCFSRADNETEAADDVTQRLLHILQIPPIETMEEEVKKQRNQREHNIDHGIWEGSSSSSSSTITTTTTERYRGDKKKKDTDEIASKYVTAVREQNILPDLVIRVVRNVAPGKLMMCASYTLPYSVAMMKPIVKYTEPIQEPPSMQSVYTESKVILRKLTDMNNALEQQRKQKESKGHSSGDNNYGNSSNGSNQPPDNDRIVPLQKRSKTE